MYIVHVAFHAWPFVFSMYFKAIRFSVKHLFIFTDNKVLAPLISAVALIIIIVTACVCVCFSLFFFSTIANKNSYITIHIHHYYGERYHLFLRRRNRKFRCCIPQRQALIENAGGAIPGLNPADCWYVSPIVVHLRQQGLDKNQRGGKRIEEESLHCDHMWWRSRGLVKCLMDLHSS